MSKVKWFDVCCDYSLDEREAAPDDLHLYRKSDRGETADYILVYYAHRTDNEVHYAKAVRKSKVTA